MCLLMATVLSANKWLTGTEIKYLYCTLAFDAGNTCRPLNMCYLRIKSIIQVNLDMTDLIGPGKLVRHMHNPLYTYDEYLICIGLSPSISSVKCENPSYSGPSYPNSPVVIWYESFSYKRYRNFQR